MSCQHPCPEPYDADGICPACEFLGEHADRHGLGGCEECSAVAKANDAGAEREMYLEVLADNMLQEVVRLYAAAGKDALAVELQVRRWFVDPPVICGPGFQAYLERADQLVAMSYAAYLQTPEWAEQRRRARARASDRCQGCATDKHLELHHATYERRGQEFAEDLTLLCSACHTAVHLVADGRRGKVRTESRRGLS